MQDFIVLDTEGTESCLRELAIVDRHGQTLCNLFVEEAIDGATQRWHVAPLQTVLETFLQHARGKQVVCHYAEHDCRVLQSSCERLGISWENIEFDCTVQLAKSLHPHIAGYKLQFLCKHLDLQWEKRSFIEAHAHTALYDTQFTYLLYRKLKSQQLQQQLKGKPNPFGDSRVDNPFENHIDSPCVYQNEFSQLTAILDEIQRDPNHQSKGAVIIGEAGNGKSHLIMRLAQERLKNNRLLFIRQPNHPDTILYHIYSRILESFMETVPNSEYSQLEYLLAHSFSRIVLEHFGKKGENVNQKQSLFIKRITKNHLSIYEAIGKEGTEQKRNNWSFIEKRTIDWWTTNYGFSNHGADIIKGLIKFCSYVDKNKRSLVRKWLAGQSLEENEAQEIGLSNWQEDVDREEFALQAIRVFSKLSIEDQPLIIVFDQLESLRDHQILLQNFGEGLKQLFTEISNSLIILTLFPDRWIHFQQFFDSSIIDRISQNKVYLNRPKEEELAQILTVKASAYEIDIEELFMPEEVSDIVRQVSIRTMLNVASDYYRFKADNVPLPRHIRNFEESVLSELEKLKAELKAQRHELEKIKRKLNLSETPVETLPSGDVEILEYLELQRQQFAQRYEHAIITDSDDWGKLNFLVKIWQEYKSFKIEYLHLRKRLLPEHIVLVFPKEGDIPEQKRFVGFLHGEGAGVTTRLKNLNTLVVSHSDVLFALFHDERSEIKSKIAMEEVNRFRGQGSNSFIYLKQEARLLFEALYKTVLDIQNHDYNADIHTVFTSFFTSYPDHWFTKFVK
jgi:Cdc6-like AAA superfamily ATPase